MRRRLLLIAVGILGVFWLKAQEKLDNSYIYEFSLVQKMLGDELFMSNNVDSAFFYYDSAENELMHLSLEDRAIDINLINLLKKEVSYRKKLIKNGFDFWGAGLSTQPFNPLIAFTDLENAVNSLEQTYKEIDQLFQNINKDEDSFNFADVQKEWNKYSAEINDVDASRLDLVNDFEANVIAKAEEQIEYFINRQKKLDQETQSNLQAIANSQEALNKGITDAFIQSSGMPAELTALDPDKSLEENLLSAGSRMLASENSSIYEDLGSLSETFKEARKLYETADSVYERFNDAKKMAEKVDKFIRKPSFEGFISIGKNIYQELDSETQQEWKAAILDSQPVQLLFELSVQNAAVKKAIIDELYEQMENTDEFEKLLLDIVENLELDLKVIFQELMQEVCSLTLELDAKKEIINLIAKNWPASFVENCMEPMIKKLLKKLGVSTKAELIEKLANSDLKQIPGYRLENGKIYIDNEEEVIDVAQLLRIPSSRDIEAGAVDAKAEIKKLISSMHDTQKDILKLVVDRFPVFDVEYYLKDFFGKGTMLDSKKASLFTGAVDNLSAKERNEFLTVATYLDMGGRFAKENSEKLIPNESLDSLFNDPVNSEYGDLAMDMLTNSALTYLSPGAVVALKLLDQFNSLNLLIEEQKAITEEMKYLAGQIIEKGTLLEKSRKNLGVTKAETEMALLMKAAARAQVNGYESIMRKKVKTITKTRAKITIRLAYYYYQAEELRAKYYKLDRAMKLWFNTSIVDMIKSNTQNIRYALDEDILLYNWLDPEIETQRANLDSLTYHWKFLTATIKNNCDYCKSGVVQLPVQQTEQIRLSDLLSIQEWGKFLKWKKEGVGDLDLEFRLNPEKDIVNDNLSNVRVVQVRIGGALPSSENRLKPVSLSSFFKLTHPGISWIYQNGKPNEDLRKLKNSVSISDGYNDGNEPDFISEDNWPNEFDLDDLRNRWSVPGGTSFRDFEGYGLYTTWNIKIINRPENKALEDIFLRFAFQFNQGDFIYKFKPFDIVLITQSGSRIPVDSEYLSSFNDEKELRSFLSNMIAEQELFKGYEIN